MLYSRSPISEGQVMYKSPGSQTLLGSPAFGPRQVADTCLAHKVPSSASQGKEVQGWKVSGHLNLASPTSPWEVEALITAHPPLSQWKPIPWEFRQDRLCQGGQSGWGSELVEEAEKDHRGLLSPPRCHTHHTYHT